MKYINNSTFDFITKEEYEKDLELGLDVSEFDESLCKCCGGDGCIMCSPELFNQFNQ